MLKRSSERKAVLEPIKVSHTLEQKEPDGSICVIDTLEAAISRKAMLLEAIQEIDIALGDNNRTDVYGNRLDYEEWNDWRTKAKWAKKFRCKHYSEIKEYIKEWNKRVYNTPLGMISEDGIVKDAFVFLCRNKGTFRAVADNPSEFENLVDRMRAFLLDNLKNNHD